MNEFNTTKSVNELQAEINRNQAIIEMIEEGIENENYMLVKEAILNLRNGVGEGYREGDYYAGTRYYIQQNGIKNISVGNSMDNRIVYVKILSPKGELLPEYIKAGGLEYRVSFIQSRNYEGEIDY